MGFLSDLWVFAVVLHKSALLVAPLAGSGNIALVVAAGNIGMGGLPLNIHNINV